MKTMCALWLATLLALLTSSAEAVTIFSQDFEAATPVNYTNTPFFVADFAGQPAGTRYFNLSNVPAGLNPNITGATGNYITVQNADMSPDGVFPAYSNTNPPLVTFNSVPVTGFNNLQLSVSLAGIGNVELANFLSAKVDVDGDSIYETTLFNFQGSDAPTNSPYVDNGPSLLTPNLSAAFGTYTVNIPNPTSGNLNLQFQIYNDTDSRNENSGFDNIVVSGTPIVGGNDPILVTALPPTGTGRTAGETVQLSNAPSGVNPRDAATVSGVATTGSGFSQTGISNGSLAAGASQTGTIAFSPAGLLNGPVNGSLNFTVASGANGAGTGAGPYAYPLSATVSGNSGNQATVVAGGGSLANLSGKSDKTDQSTATILAGTVAGANPATVAMSWRERTAGETPPNGAHPLLPDFANGLTSDVMTLTGTDTHLQVLQMTYNPAELQQPDTNNQAIGHLFLASTDQAGNWVNTRLLNHGVNTTDAASLNFLGPYSLFAATHPLGAATLGAWGVDPVNDVVWAVIDHNGAFASVPEPSSILLGSFGLLGLVFGAIRRRRP